MEDLKLVEGGDAVEDLHHFVTNFQQFYTENLAHVFFLISSRFSCFLLLDFTFPLFLSLLSLRSFLFSVHYSTCSLYYLLSSPFTRFTFFSILSFFPLFYRFPSSLFLSLFPFQSSPCSSTSFSSRSSLSPPTMLNAKLFSK